MLKPVTMISSKALISDISKSLSGIEWTLMPNSALSQTDNYNCGAHVCYNFLCLINGQIPLKINMDEYRSEILSVIKSASSNN